MIKIFIFVVIILFIIYFNIYIQPQAKRDTVVINREAFVPLSSYLPSSQKEINLKSLNYPDNCFLKKEPKWRRPYNKSAPFYGNPYWGPSYWKGGQLIPNYNTL